MAASPSPCGRQPAPDLIRTWLVANARATSRVRAHALANIRVAGNAAAAPRPPRGPSPLGGSPQAERVSVARQAESKQAIPVCFQVREASAFALDLSASRD